MTSLNQWTPTTIPAGVTCFAWGDPGLFCTWGTQPQNSFNVDLGGGVEIDNVWAVQTTSVNSNTIDAIDFSTDPDPPAGSPFVHLTGFLDTPASSTVTASAQIGLFGAGNSNFADGGLVLAIQTQDAANNWNDAIVTSSPATTLPLNASTVILMNASVSVAPDTAVRAELREGPAYGSSAYETGFDVRGAALVVPECVPDVSNPGKCLGDTPPLGVTTLASGQGDTAVLAADASYAYWVSSGAVVRASLGGASPPATLATGAGSAEDIKVNAANVYWTVGGASGAVMQVPTGGGTPITLASGLNYPTSIAVDATNVYWAETSLANSTGGALKKTPIGGGTATTLASGLSYPGGIAVDANNLYWTNFTSVMSVHLGGGTPTTLATGLTGEPDSYTAIVVDATSAYWTSGNKVMSVPLAGGAPVTVAAGSSSDGYVSTALAVDATNVYWMDVTTAGGSVMTAPITGGTPTTLASGQTFYYFAHLAIDSTSVYWGNSSGAGSLMSVNPK